MSNDMRDMTMADQAVWMADELGAGIIPLAKGSKRPQESGWQTKGRYAEEDIRECLEGTDGYGILCNGITVVDFDPRNMALRDPEDDNEFEFLFALIREAYNLSDTLEIATGSAGMHLYYRGESPLSKLKDTIGVDIKSGHGNQVVGPGSLHASTRKEYWVRHKGVPQQVPGILAGASKSGSSLGEKKEPAFIPEEGFGEGNRNDGMIAHLGRMRNFGLDDSEIELYAEIVNRNHCNPPLSKSELATIVHSVQQWDIGQAYMDSITVQRDAVVETAEGKHKVEGPKGWLTRPQLAQLEPPKYLIDKVLPNKGVGHLVGASYAGKTFVAIDLAMSLASKEKTEWLGHELSGSHRIAYIAMEGGFDLGQRIKAWESTYGEVPRDSMLFLVEDPFDMTNDDGIAPIKRMTDFQPSVIFIDTQSLAAPGLDENSNSDMTSLMHTAKLISVAHKCLVILVHHTGYNGDRARGASAQFANMDVSMYVKAGKGKQPDMHRTLSFDKLKSGQLPDDMTFKLIESGNSVTVEHAPSSPEALAEENPDLFVFEANPKEAKLLELLQHPDTPRVTRKDIEGLVDVSESTQKRMVKRLLEHLQIRECELLSDGTKVFEYYPPDERPVSFKDKLLAFVNQEDGDNVTFESLQGFIADNTPEKEPDGPEVQGNDEVGSDRE